MVVFPVPCLRAPCTRSQAAREADVSTLLSPRRDWISRIQRHARRARSRAGSAAKEVARAARRRPGAIASEARSQAGPPIVAYGFVAERDDPRARGVAAIAPQWA